MTEQEIRAVVADVVAGLALPTSGVTASVGTASVADIPVEASARHLHLTTEAVQRLFGAGAKLTKKRDLSQPGEFLCEQRLKLVTAKGQIENVAILGPERDAVQVELSFTDARQLGIKAPLRLSGDLSGGADLLLVGDCGVLEAKGCAIVAQNHIHMTNADAARYGLHNGQRVDVQVQAGRSVVFQQVAVRVSDSFALAMHLDFDEANACGLCCGSKGALVGASSAAAATPAPAAVQVATPTVSRTEKVITEVVARRMAEQCTGKLTLPAGTIVTPSARDIFRQHAIELQIDRKGQQR